MITYEDRSIAGKPMKDIVVKLNGKLAGRIKGVWGRGFRYYAKGGQEGEIFTTVQEVKESLEG